MGLDISPTVNCEKFSAAFCIFSCWLSSTFVPWLANSTSKLDHCVASIDDRISSGPERKAKFLFDLRGTQIVKCHGNGTVIKHHNSSRGGGGGFRLKLHIEVRFK